MEQITSSWTPIIFKTINLLPFSLDIISPPHINTMYNNHILQWLWMFLKIILIIKAPSLPLIITHSIKTKSIESCTAPPSKTQFLVKPSQLVNCKQWGASFRTVNKLRTKIIKCSINMLLIQHINTLKMLGKNKVQSNMNLEILTIKPTNFKDFLNSTYNLKA